MTGFYRQFCLSAFAAGAVVLPARAPAAESPLHVVVAPAAQRASGIAVTALKPARYLPRRDAYARVLDPAPLLALRGRLSAAQAQLVASRKEYERLKELNQRGQNVSDKTLQAAEATWRTDRARADALHATALQRWGPVLVRWLEGRDSTALDGLARGTEHLLSISVPADKRQITPAERIALEAGGSARLVSAAPMVDPEIQAPVFFYLTRAALPAGYRFGVGMPSTAKVETGVRVPASAVLWYGGKAWVYVRISAAEFERRLITTDAPDGDGWFVTENLPPGSALVVNGAELLFAEEFKASLPAGGEGDED